MNGSVAVTQQLGLSAPATGLLKPRKDRIAEYSNNPRLKNLIFF